jgi:hypothetical protein
VSHSRKSAAQQALQRSRQAAIANGTLPQWYEARRAEQAQERAVRDAQSEAPTPTTPASTPITTLEAVSWPEGQRYPRWLLPTRSMTPNTARNPY